MRALTERVTGKLGLVLGEDGLVRIEVRTSKRLREVSFKWDVGRDRVTHRMVFESGLLPEQSVLSKDVTSSVYARRLGDWRFLGIVVMFGGLNFEFRRLLDLGEGSRERELTALLVEQDEIEVVWVNEQTVTQAEFSDLRRNAVREALEGSVGVTRAQWRERLAELEWRESASFDPRRPRPRPYKPRTAARPDVPVPFFATRSGALPKARGATLAGLDLPAGRRVPSTFAAYWCSRKPVADIEQTSQRLMLAFPQTGIWPLCWCHPEDPEAYMGGHGNLDAIEEVDVLALMRAGWGRFTDGRPLGSFTAFPGLAHASNTDNNHTGRTLRSDVEEEARLLLVPCNRPADSITQLGGIAAEVDPPQCSAILRSWEERFGAVPIEVAPSRI